MGSLAITSDPARVESTFVGLAYPSSKSALNMLTSQWARAYPDDADQRRRSRLHGDRLQPPPGTQTVQEGAEAIVRLATIGPEGPTGTYAGRGRHHAVVSQFRGA